MTLKNEKFEMIIQPEITKKIEPVLSLKHDIENMGFELKTFDDGIEKITWYERILVPENQNTDPIVICFSIVKQEFYFENFPGIRFKEIDRARLFCKAFSGLKNIQ